MSVPIPLPRIRPPEPNTPLPQPWLPLPKPRLPVMTVNGNRPDEKGNVEVPLPDVVAPSEKAREGQAADAKATHEALEEVRGSIGKVDEKADTLIGEDAGKSVREIAGEETEKIVGGATDAYDTLKEIEEWIEKDEAGAVALVKRVNEIESTKANTSDLAEYKKKQQPVDSPSSTTGDAASFVWRVTQDAEGVISQVRRNVIQAAPNTFGLVKLVNVYNDTSEAKGRAVSSKALGEAYKALSENDAEIERRVKSLEENGSGSSVEVVEPNSSAKTGQAADAEAVYKNFRLKNDLNYVESEVETVPVWTFSLALDGEEFDTVDMTLQRSYVSDLGNDEEEWAGYSARGKYRCELLRSLGGISGTSTFRATIEGVPVTSTVYQGASAWEKPFTFSGMTLRGSPLTASGAYSSSKQVEVVTEIDKIALESAVKEELGKKLDKNQSINNTVGGEVIVANGDGTVTASITNVTELVKLSDIVSPSAAGQGKAADAKAVYNNFKRVQTAKSSPYASGNGTSFIDTISQDAQGVITATKKNIRTARNPYETGLVKLLGCRFSELASTSGYYDRDEKLFGQLDSAGDFGAASNQALAYTTLGHVRFFTLDPDKDMDHICYIDPLPFCHDIHSMPYGPPSNIVFIFDADRSYPWQVLESDLSLERPWAASKKAIVEIDAFDIRNDVPIEFAANFREEGFGVTGLAYGNCNKDEWNRVTAGMINRFYLEMNYNRLTVIKYAFPQYLYTGGGSSYWSSYYSSYWSSYYSSYWSSYYSY